MGKYEMPPLGKAGRTGNPDLPPGFTSGARNQQQEVMQPATTSATALNSQSEDEPGRKQQAIR